MAFLTLLIPSNLLFSLLNCPILLQSSLLGEVTLFQEIFAWVGLEERWLPWKYWETILDLRQAEYLAAELRVLGPWWRRIYH